MNCWSNPVSIDLFRYSNWQLCNYSAVTSWSVHLQIRNLNLPFALSFINFFFMLESICYESLSLVCSSIELLSEPLLTHAAATNASKNLLVFFLILIEYFPLEKSINRAKECVFRDEGKVVPFSWDQKRKKKTLHLIFLVIRSCQSTPGAVNRVIGNCYAV